MNGRIGKLLVTLATATGLLGLGAIPALAAPELDVTLESDSGAPASEFPVVFHSDERVDYTVEVGNTAPPSTSVGIGQTLTCEAANWTQEETSGFELSFKWLSNGAEVGAGDSYEVQASDLGYALQCRVKGENSAGANAAASPSLVVGSPSPAPPAYSGPGSSRPTIAKTEDLGNEEEWTCTPPAAGVWTGSPTWSYQWLRNGEPLESAEDIANGSQTAVYTAHAEEADESSAIQCMVKGENAGGAIVSISNAGGFIGPFPGDFPPRNNGGPPVIFDPNTIVAPVTLELELPGGAGTFAHEVSGNGWSCEAQPAAGAQSARVLCGREDQLEPGEEFQTLSVVAALGADAPDLASARATAFGGGAAPASDEVSFPLGPAKPFGLTSFTARLLDEMGEDHTQAGGHPFEGRSELALSRKRALVPSAPSISSQRPIEQLKQLVIDVPPGVAGNRLAFPELCPGTEELTEGGCPSASAVGGVALSAEGFGSNSTLYAIEPEFGTPAQFAFADPVGNVYTLSARLRPADGYAISLVVAPAPQTSILGSVGRLCAFGAKGTAKKFEGCREAGEPGANPKPLFTNPTRCNAPLETRARVNSWEDSSFVEGPPFANERITGCDAVPFEPSSDLEPTSGEADSPTGLDVELRMPSEGLEGKDPDGTPNPEAISQSHLREATITLPEGMAVNPSAATGLGACSPGQIGLGTDDPVSCPDSSKVGTVEVETPILDETLKGAIYVARQGAVDGSLLGLYLAFDSPKDGILIKQASAIEPDPVSGRLTATVRQIPQAPFSAVRISMPGGDRATLLNPPRCGTYEIVNELVPWSGGAPVTQTSKFEVSSGPGNTPCPKDPLLPTLQSGVTAPVAGAPSPFVVRLHRPDGSDRFKAVGMHVPTGLVAKLKGIPYCPEAVLAAIPGAAGSGQGEIDSPSCPAASQVGRVVVGAGAGPDPFYTDTPRAYLAGPYKGAPVSIAVVAPAVAGPLDLGNVVVRNAVYLDPKTAKIDVVSDPIPHILQGLLLDVRDVRVLVDRPNFTQNPTDCSAKRVVTDVRGLVETAIASPFNPFQVGSCRALGFKPRINLRLFGGIHRGDYQGLRAVVRPRPGDANIGRTVVRFPRSAFVAQENFRTICTRVQFKADACPKGAIYGKAIAYSPLLDLPLKGNVYLRSSDNELPDLVADLRGPAHQPIRVELVGRTDSARGALRNTFDTVPDAPVSYFRLNLFGKRKALIVNSRNICRGANKAAVTMNAQNGRRALLRPQLHSKRCAKRRQARRKRARRAAKRAAARRNRLAAPARSNRAG